MDIVLSLSLKRKNKIEEMEKMKMIFKSGGVATCLFAAAFSSVTYGLTAAEQPQQAEYVFHGAGNPYLPLWEHLPDGFHQIGCIHHVPLSFDGISEDRAFIAPTRQILYGC